MNVEKPWHYISFADDTGFLGAVVVRGSDLVDAVKEAHRLKINPGGEALGGAIPDGGVLPEHARNRLLSKADVDAIWGDGVRLGDYEQENPGAKERLIANGCFVDQRSTGR